MALDLTKLETAHGGKGVKVWTYYTSTDNKAAVKGANYFDNAANHLQVGDRLMIHASDADFDAHVSAISSGAVTIAAVDAFA